MAYPQFPNAHSQQPRQQQYYNQGAPPPPRQHAAYDDQHNYYNDQYDYDYDYDQGQYAQWDNGYYDQQQEGWGTQQHQQQHQQQKGGYARPNGHMNQAPQGRRPPPQDQYAQPVHDGQQYQSPQGHGPRGRPTGPNGDAAMRGGMQRGDRRPPNLQQGPPGSRPPRTDRPRMAPASPKIVSQDNPFPVFPTQKEKQRVKAGSVEDDMALMNIGGKEDSRERAHGPPQGRGRGPVSPPQQRGPPPGRGGGYNDPDMQRQDSGHFEGDRRGQQRPPRGYPQQRPPPMSLEGAQRPPPRRFDPASPTQQGFAPQFQRSVTMPQNRSAATNGGGYEGQQQWVEPGSVAGYHGPESPAYIPPRPATASGTKNENYAQQQQQQHQQKPPMPHIPPQHQQNPQYQAAQVEPQGDLDNFYDDYFGDNATADRKSKASSIEMPDFDAIQDSGTRHRRGYSIENHLSPSSVPQMQGIAAAAAAPAPTANAQRNNFYQQAARSRSQPDLHGQYSQNAVYEMAGDAPALPPVPMNVNQQPPVGLPSGPRGGRGPPQRNMTMGAMPQRTPSNPGYGQQGQQANFDPRYRQQQPPIHRGYSEQSTYSEPANMMQNGSPMAAGAPIARPGTAAPAPRRMPSDPVARRPGTTQPVNPDALPAHPVPVRAGLMQQTQEPAPAQQGSRPPPVRHYNTDPAPGPYGGQQSSMSPQRRASSVSVAHPVTHDELNRLRNTWRANPGDSAAGLQLAKKLAEASNVLADEGGTADTRTRNKNRERFITEALKTVKKLAHGGSADAMFYLADCYGTGKLGLAVDPKEAFTLYQSAAKAGHAASAYRTAVCCEMGHEDGGTKRDLPKAVQWYRRAAALGDPAAMYKMGIILLKGLLGQQRNLGEAINMLKRAADRADEANPHALHELALLYEAQTGNERIIRDEAYSAQLFMQAAELGYKFSQYRLGQAYEYGLLGYPIDARASIAWYTRAAVQEEHQSELALSGWYLTGSQGILEQSDTEAYLWARKAACAEPPLAKALFAMGYFTEVGIGCPRSLEEAKRWYGRAATYKFPKAQERLEELKRGGAKVQRGRERLSRTNQKQHEENCSVM